MKVIDKNLTPSLHYLINNHHKYNDHTEILMKSMAKSTENPKILKSINNFQT